ncbi:MAG TPA: hypothetical protein VL832_18990 [Puia sp.]|nr:hypothetical protein [Puia sp.]
MAIPVSTDSNRIEQVATISAGNNLEIGKLIADAMRRAGKEGVNIVFVKCRIQHQVPVLFYSLSHQFQHFMVNP